MRIQELHYRLQIISDKDMNIVRTERLINTFMNMVRIDSESGQEKAFAAYLCSLANSLQFTCWQDTFTNVYISIPGTGIPLMLNTHMDTVRPGRGIHPIISGEYITSDGSTVLGSDSKSAIAAMFELVRILQENSITHRPILLTFSCNEETGIPTAQHIVSEITECIVPDRSTPLGEIIIRAPYDQVFEITVTGKTAYATTHFCDGRHAIRSASAMIHHIPIGDIDPYTTSNIGIITGGVMTSMVPETCTFKGSCYSFRKSSFRRFFNNLRMIVGYTDKLYGTNSRIRMLEYFPGFSIKRNDPLVKATEKAIRLAKISPKYITYKAVTNANLLNSIGIKTVLISNGVENQHTTEERIKIQTLIKLVEILFYCVAS